MNDVMKNAIDNGVDSKKKRRSPWPYAIVGFLAVVVVVNMVFLYAAVTTNDGLVDEEYYAKGILYNKTLADEAVLGWQVELTSRSTEKLKAKAVNGFEVNVIGKDGLPLKGLSVRAVLMRPATNRYDKEASFLFNGRSYNGEFYIPLKGLWDIKVIVEEGESIVERVFRVDV